MSVAKRIIPCLDVDKGRVVKGVNFLNIRDAGDPVEIAKRYDTEGADEITMLDITASHETRDTTYKTVESIASQVFIPLTVGGGVRKIEDIKKLLRSGADKVSINTSAVENPSFVKEAADKFGSQCIVVAVDAKAKTDKENSWEVVTYGGRNRTGIDVLEWTEQVTEYGAGEILLTSMDRDGTKEGFDNNLVSKVSSGMSIPVIASGGVGNRDHLIDGVTIGGADAGLAGDFVKGFNEIILALPDAAINAIAEIGERLGVVPDKDIADRNYLNRIFNQGDYEKVNPLIPYILDIGVGEKGGMSSDSLLQKLFRSAGQGAGVAVPFTVGQQKLADQVLDTVPQIGQKLGQNIKEALLRPSKTAPALTAGAETIGGSLAAGGITAEKELVGTETGIGGLVAVAPFALYYGGSTIVNKAKQYSPIGWVAKNIGNFKDEIKGLKGAGVNQNLNTTAGKQVAGEIEKAVSKPEAVDNIEKSLDIEMRLQPYAKGPIKFSPAEQTLDAPLITTQKSAESTGDTDFTRKNFERK